MQQTQSRTKADWIRLIIMILLPFTALGLLYYKLETYTQVVHNDAGALVSAYAVACFVAVSVLWGKSFKKGAGFGVVAIAALLVLSFVFYVGEKIPFCVECDHITAEDLGFLTYWIPPCAS